MIKYSYKITSNNVAPKEGEMFLIITSACMQITASTADGFTETMASQFDFQAPNPASYTPFDQVTEQMIIGWIMEMYSEIVDQIENQLADEIAIDIANNIIVNHPLPF
jgi:hypothetical protein